MLKSGEVWERADGSRFVLDKWFQLGNEGHWWIIDKGLMTTMSEDDILKDAVKTLVQPGQRWQHMIQKTVEYEVSRYVSKYGGHGWNVYLNGDRTGYPIFYAEDFFLSDCVLIAGTLGEGRTTKTHGKAKCTRCGSDGALIMATSVLCVNKACSCFSDPKAEPWRLR